MNFDLSDDHELLRRTVRDFAEGEVAPVAGELDRTNAIPYDIIAKLGALNLMGIPFPEEYGGAGGDTLAYALDRRGAHARRLVGRDHALRAHVARARSRSTSSAPRTSASEWMPRLCSGEILGAFGLTEAEAGSDAANTKTRARARRRRVGHRRRQAVHHERRHRHLGRS